MMFIDLKTLGGEETGEIKLYCEALGVTRQGFYHYLKTKNKVWKYQYIADEIMKILAEDEYNDRYGRKRMRESLVQSLGEDNVPHERTIYRIMEKIGIVVRVKRKPHGITKADREAQKSDDLLRRNFTAPSPFVKCVTDITEIITVQKKLYLAVLFDCFSGMVLGMAIADNMNASLCVAMLENALLSYPQLKGAIIHSDRGAQYTSREYRACLKKYGLRQSMNSRAGRCHDNARCESFWARMKEELFYNRYDTRKMKMEEVKSLIWRYFYSYWNNRRVCSFNDGLPPAVKLEQYYNGNWEN